MVLEAILHNAEALAFASIELQTSLPTYIESSLQAHRDFALIVQGACRQPAPASEELEARNSIQELPLTMINRQGYYHGLIFKKLIADFAGVPFGRAFARLRDADSSLKRTAK